MYFKIITYSRQNLHITIKNSSITENTCSYGCGAFIYVSHRLLNVSAPLVSFQQSNFSRNQYFEVLKDSHFIGQHYDDGPVLGILWLASVKRVNIIDCIFYQNTLTALTVMKSNIVFAGNNSFISNIGINGGAIGLQSSSRLYLHSPTKLTFSNNLALMNGGAIYAEDSSILPLETDGCFFQIYEPNPSGHCQENVHVFFSNNSALISGASIFGGLLTYCYQEAVSCYQGMKGNAVIKKSISL